MDFFESQHKAHKKTGRLVVLFVLAVAAIVVTVHVVLSLIFTGVAASQVHKIGNPPPNLLLDPRMFLGVAVGIIAIVLLATLYRMSQLRHGGGRLVAESMGGRLLDPGSVNPQERKILNVVEEMAIASGVPVPPVYLLDDEKGINAFAAGYTSSDAVIGVTRGCVELLDRDQLQGVMAHEFSHILNGDMRLNIRLIGIVFGILVLGLIGQMMVRSMLYAPRRRSSKDSGGAMLAMLAIGVTLIVLGALGVFFGNLIKAAISRQREFLADASAVQFTRYPEGIAGALKRIGGYTYHAQLVHAKAAEASHMYFGQGVSAWMGMLATHPPLEERIARIDPQWDGKYPEIELPEFVQEEHQERKQRYAEMTRERRAAAMAAAAAAASGVAAAGLMNQIGNPSPQHMAHASDLISRLDDSLKSAAREPYGARAVIYALLLDRGDEIRHKQIETLHKQADPRVAELTLKLAEVAAKLDPALRLPLIDLAVPSLRQLSEMQYRVFRGNVDALIDADQRVNLMEWTLRRIVMRHLASQFGDVHRPVVQYYNLRGLRQECALLLSLLAYVGNTDQEAGLTAFNAGAAALQIPDLRPLPPDHCSLQALGEALDKLNQVAPRAKRPLITAIVATITSDQRTTIQEVELLRAICATLDCPAPPLLPDV